MPAARTSQLFLFFAFLSLQANYISFSQTSPYPTKEWIKKLEVKNDVLNKNFLEIIEELNSKDSAFVSGILSELQNYQSHNRYYNARVFVLKAGAEYRFHKNSAAVEQYMKKALDEAYRSHDEYLISSVCQDYGGLMYACQEIELSATYYLNAEEINERLGVKDENALGMHVQLGEVLFHAREYERSIYYLHKGLDNWRDTSALSTYYKIRFWNAVGQDYQQLGKLDSALVNYKTSMQIATHAKNLVWEGINSGFMGQIFFLWKQYDKAKSLLEYDYDINKTYDPNIAGYSLQWLARINLLQGRKDSALEQAKQALAFLKKSNWFPLQRANYLEAAYYTTADVFRSRGNADSFYYYFQLYSSLHDSLETLAALSSIKMSQIRIDNENNYRTIQSLEREKKMQLLLRNFILLALVLAAVIVIMVLNRQKQRSIHKQQLAVQEKMLVEAEVAAAKDQLNMFKQNIIEKTSLIEKLQEQVQRRETSEEEAKIVEELSRQTILTEEHWDKFRTLFEKIYPGFFMKLKEKAADITLAEQRMAALTRLHLTVKQMASMLGISVDSVHKTRYRLRQRLQLNADANLEEAVSHV